MTRRGGSSRWNGGLRWWLWTVLYRLEVVLALLLVEPFRVLRRGRGHLETLRIRLGLYREPPAVRGAVWLHAPTVGELQVASVLVASLPADLPLLVTVYFEHGWSERVAEERFAGRATVTHPPFMLTSATRRFLDHFAPRAFVLVESQAWLLVSLGLARASLPMAIVNANVAWRTRPILSHRLVQPLLPALDAVGVRSEADGREYVALGARSERVVVTGNVKLELPPVPELPELKTRLRELAADRPILAAGCVHTLEEALNVLSAFEEIGAGERALLLLAPRLVPTVAPMSELALRRGHRLVRRSALPAGGRPSVVVLDTLGELASLYEVAVAAFLGGTLGARGGHNPAEPARFGLPIVAGPHMEHFLSIAELFDRAGAWRRVDDARGLAAAWDEWLEEPEKGRSLGQRAARLLAEHRGAVERTRRLLSPLLGREAG